MTRFNIRSHLTSGSFFAPRAILPVIAACLLAILAAGQTLADNKNCGEEVQNKLNSIERSLREDFILQTQIYSQAMGLLAEEGGCLAEDERAELSLLLVNTDPLPIQLSMPEVWVAIDSCFLKGGLDGDAYGKAQAQAERIEALADRVQQLMFRVFDVLDSVPDCD